MKDFHSFLENTFTMVEENFEFYSSEMLQNEGSLFISEVYLRHGWRKFWDLRSEMLQKEGFPLISGETFTKEVGFFPKLGKCHSLPCIREQYNQSLFLPFRQKNTPHIFAKAMIGADIFPLVDRKSKVVFLSSRQSYQGYVSSPKFELTHRSWFLTLTFRKH